MKKLLAMSAALAMFCTSFSMVSANAADTLKLEAAEIAAETGETIAVPVNITENPGIVAISFTVDYNAEALELVSVDDGKLFSGASFTAGGDVTAVPYRVMWDDGLAADDYTDIGTIATLNFRVLDTAESGIYEISVNVEADNTFNVNFDDVSFETVNGSVTIQSEEPTETETESETETEAPTETESESATETEEPTETESESATETEEPTETESESVTEIEEPTETETESAIETEESTETESESAIETEESTETESESATETEELTEMETESATETEEPTETESESVTETEEPTETETESETEESTEVEETAETEASPATTDSFSENKLCEMIRVDFRQKNGAFYQFGDIATNEDGTISFEVMSSSGQSLGSYTIDPKTGIGTDNNGEEVNLPQTGNNSLGTVTTAAGAAALTILGAFAVTKSGVFRKKKENE